jgi:hypothetical protein
MIHHTRSFDACKRRLVLSFIVSVPHDRYRFTIPKLGSIVECHYYKVLQLILTLKVDMGLLTISPIILGQW